jgi:transposase InsO family protein
MLRFGSTAYALCEHGTPEMFNSDQGSQFTSAAFTDMLKPEGAAISMDGRRRSLDNVLTAGSTLHYAVCHHQCRKVEEESR